MSAQINGLLHCGADIGIGPGGNIVETVGAALAAGISGKLIHIPPGLEPKMPEGFKAGGLTEDREIELTAFFYKFLRKITLIHRDAYAVWLAGHLDAGVNDTAAVPTSKAEVRTNSP